MKFQVQMKDPDTLQDAIEDAINAQTSDEITEAEELQAILEIRSKRISQQCNRWFRYGEYLTVEIDTDAGTCVVVENK